MKIGVSYNLFDGEELLEGSIVQIRDSVDYISVVYQKTSNYGQPCSEELEEFLNELKEEKLIDELLLYEPDLNKSGHYNELMKRNLGLRLSIMKNCTHHMSMDSDEYYLPNQFEFLKKEINRNDYDATLCKMRTYYKTWEYQLDPPEEYYVTMIYKINENSKYDFTVNFPVLVDPTRRIASNNIKIFERDKIEMHHGSYIRKNLTSKIINSNIPMEYKNFTNDIVEYYKNWTYPNPVMWVNIPPKFLNVKKIKPIFELDYEEQ